MKNIIKNLTIICCVGLFLTGCTLLNNPSEQEDDDQTETKQFENMDKIDSVLDTTEMTSFDYEDFTITVKNAGISTLNKDVIEDLIQYNVYSTVKVDEHEISLIYQGINMSDLITLLVPEDYTKVVFKGNGYTVTVPKEDMVNSFLIFKVDGKSLNEWGPAKIYLSTYAPETWIENVTEIDFE